MINKIANEENIINAIRSTLSGNHSDYANRILARIEFFANALSETILDVDNFKIGGIQKIIIFEPKKREIECFNIKDRIIHKAIWSVIQCKLERNFVSTTYACIKGRGGSKASNDLFNYINKRSDYYYLKVDVKSYFASIHKPTLFKIIRKYIKCDKTMKLLKEIMYYNSSDFGIPIGSVLSQTFGNLYLSKLDNHLSRQGIKFWRYMDDVIVVCKYKEDTKRILKIIETFIHDKLKLSLNNRTVINKVSNGINFVGYIHYPTHIRMKKVTLKRINKKINQNNKNSYYGYLMHGNNYKVLLEYKRKMDVIDNRTENNQ